MRINRTKATCVSFDFNRLLIFFWTLVIEHPTQCPSLPYLQTLTQGLKNFGIRNSLTQCAARIKYGADPRLRVNGDYRDSLAQLKIKHHRLKN